MILRQFLHTDPVIAASYVFGCGTKRTACVVDPVADPDFYLAAASSLGMEIRCVIDTHVHADHLSSGPQLAEVARADYLLHESAAAELAFEPVREGQRVELGNTVVEVMHLPGHTPEHIGLLVSDRVRTPEPWFIVAGHTLMVGDMGRTELASSVEEGAQALFGSAERLRALPDHIEVLPGAFAGSVCGRGLSGKTTSTIGFERRFNRAFSVTDPEAFVRLMLEDIPPQPPGFAEIRARNRGQTVAAGR